MKEFFEEYGRTIVTVLIILGIILVGYVIAGNGRTSAFGRFTTDVVDSLSGQANSLLKDSPENIERALKKQQKTSLGYAGGNYTISEGNGIYHVTVSGKATPWIDGEDTNLQTFNSLETPWNKKSVMSFDIISDATRTLTIDTNADPGNDNYSHPVCSSVDGNVHYTDTSATELALTASKWHHVIVILKNGNEDYNPKHLPTITKNVLKFNQDSGTTNYQIKNLKYGVTE